MNSGAKNSATNDAWPTNRPAEAVRRGGRLPTNAADAPALAGQVEEGSGLSRIEKTFRNLRARGAAALMPFFACGHPDIETTRASCIAAREAGADIVELGIPFSDPIADGPVIQSAFASALRGGFRVRDAFRLAESLRRDSFDIPLVAMVSYSLIFRAKTEVFARDAAGAGFDGLIVPDLPFDADESFREVCRARGLATVPLVAPTTPPRRRAEIVRSASGFIYYVSVAGITGERDRLPPDLARNVRAIKAISSLPVCVGFGISRPEHAAAAGRMADGVIVGSALVKRISEMASSGVSLPEAMRALAADIRLLAEAAHGRR